MKKAQQRLFFLRKHKKDKVPSQLFVNFYRSIIESILCHCIIVWYTSCTIQNRRDLAQIVKIAQRIVGTKFPDLDNIYSSRLHTNASNIIKDSTHPSHRLFEPLPSGKRYRAVRTRTNRLRNSFFPRVVACITPLSFTCTDTVVGTWRLQRNLSCLPASSALSTLLFVFLLCIVMYFSAIMLLVLRVTKHISLYFYNYNKVSMLFNKEWVN